MATSPPPLVSVPWPATRTRRLLRSPGVPDEPDTTDYELSASVASPPVKFQRAAATAPTTRGLSPAAARLFHERLRLCCLIATAPFAFYLLSGLTDLVEIFSHETVGTTGVVLSGAVIVALSGIAGALFWLSPRTEPTLRVIEVAVFGIMSLFFAYTQFIVLTTMPQAANVMGLRFLQSTVLAAAAITHFNWFALIVFHAVLVPNTIGRGVAFTLTMVVVALTIDAFAAIVHLPAGRVSPGLFAIAATMLGVGAGLAIFGTAKTVELQREVESAREAVRELGQYRLRKKLGSGGMGEVYLAEHHLLKRPCAVKRIHARYLNSPEQLKRFEREVQATAQLRHPNTVEIYDYGIAEDGTFYYVMEYLPGVSLEELVGRFGPQPPDRAIHILRQVCGALREAHRHGLVHRDIKPSNILIFAEGAPHDQVKLVDFGLVHSLGWEGDPGTKITREGLIVGTPEYMSPEQASGGSLDGRSDLFSLGSVAYYLLTGREAFHRDNPMKTLMAVVTELPIPLADANPHLPEDLRAVVAKCLSKDPNERYHTAADLELALAACPGAGTWTEPRSAEWWAAHPQAAPGTGTDLESLPLRD